jgi:cobalt-zinc-cadmium efflux system membrane fusion protein
MFASISIVTGHATSTAAVPESAIIHEGEATHLWVENKDGSLVSRQVRTGQGKAGMAEVLSGLAVGETVVTGGTLFIDRAANNE